MTSDKVVRFTLKGGDTMGWDTRRVTLRAVQGRCPNNPQHDVWCLPRECDDSYFGFRNMAGARAVVFQQVGLCPTCGRWIMHAETAPSGSRRAGMILTAVTWEPLSPDLSNPYDYYGNMLAALRRAIP